MDNMNYNINLTEAVKELARKLGAEMVGVGPVDRWKHAPEMPLSSRFAADLQISYNIRNNFY